MKRTVNDDDDDGGGRKRKPAKGEHKLRVNTPNDIYIFSVTKIYAHIIHADLMLFDW